MSEEEFEKLIEAMTQAIATDQFRRILAAGGMELPEGQDALAEKFARAAAEAIGLRGMAERVKELEGVLWTALAMDGTEVGRERARSLMLEAVARKSEPANAGEAA